MLELCDGYLCPDSTSRGARSVKQTRRDCHCRGQAARARPSLYETRVTNRALIGCFLKGFPHRGLERLSDWFADRGERRGKISTRSESEFSATTLCSLSLPPSPSHSLFLEAVTGRHARVARIAAAAAVTSK